MSTEQNLYIGPYLRCEVEKIQGVRKSWSCVNSECDRTEVSEAHKFCPTCGTKLEMADVPVLIDSVQIVDEGEDEEGNIVESFPGLYRGYGHLQDLEDFSEAHLWLMNDDRIIDTKYSEFVHDIDSIQEEMDDLAKRIPELEKEYGEGKVSVKFGVIQWLS